MQGRTVLAAIVAACSLVCGANGAVAEGLDGARVVENFRATTEIRGNQVAAAIGNRNIALNMNSSAAGETIRNFRATTEIRGNQVAAAIGNRNIAANINSSAIGHLRSN